MVPMGLHPVERTNDTVCACPALLPLPLPLLWRVSIDNRPPSRRLGAGFRQGKALDTTTTTIIVTLYFSLFIPSSSVDGGIRIDPRRSWPLLLPQSHRSSSRYFTLLCRSLLLCCIPLHLARSLLGSSDRVTVWIDDERVAQLKCKHRRWDFLLLLHCIPFLNHFYSTHCLSPASLNAGRQAFSIARTSKFFIVSLVCFDRPQRPRDSSFCQAIAARRRIRARLFSSLQTFPNRFQRRTLR